MESEDVAGGTEVEGGLRADGEGVEEDVFEGYTIIGASCDALSPSRPAACRIGPSVEALAAAKPPK